ncbi:MAG: DUF615 domain-containing protein [Oleiphilaceae bacterium]|nr:DUF615 domain-containing protein [Oleiphilaceae bacterium]
MSQHDPFDSNNEDFDEDIKSRSQIKREMEALQAIGKQLCELKASHLEQVPISEELEEGIATYKRISSREAKRRQLQYIGKVMRNQDIDAIQIVLDRFDTSSDIYAKRLHMLEAWRERLINEGNAALTEFVEKHPSVEIQTLRQLVRNTNKDRQNEKNTGAAKKLFKFLKQYEEDILN